jgi:hypothetical protein
MLSSVNLTSPYIKSGYRSVKLSVFETLSIYVSVYLKMRMEYCWNYDFQNTEIFRRKPTLPAKITISTVLRFNLVNQSRSLCLVAQGIDQIYEISAEGL